MDPLGVSAGKVGAAVDDPNLSNEYATIPDHSVEASSDRVIPDRVATGTERGTKTIMNVDGSYVTMGLIPDGGTDFGIAFFDQDGNIISKNTGVTQYIYDRTTGKNIMQIGKLPDGTYGMIIANAGYNVSELFS